MRNFFFALLSILLLTPLSSSAEEKNLRDFGAVPSDGQNDAPALRAAAAYCRSHPGTTLIFDPGIYLLQDDEAEEWENKVMRGDFGQDPEKKMFTPYHHYVRGMDFTGSRDITIQARGATLLCGGWMEPISIEHCQNFTLQGLIIDHLRKPMSEGHVVDIQADNFVVHFDRPSHPITMGTPFPRVTLWDKTIDGIWRDPYYFARMEIVAPNTVRFRGSLAPYMMGASVGALHTFHSRPAIFIHESQNTRLLDVTIHSQPGMGIVGFHSKDILMDHLAVVPGKGFQFSTNTDATHFASCEGEITFQGCTFLGQGDDATNVHGYYHDIAQVEQKSVTLELRAPTFTHAQLSDVPRVGDIMTLVRIRDLQPIRDYKVEAVSHQDKAIPFTIQVDSLLPQNFQDYYMINSTLMPKLTMRDCVDWGHIARGILVKTTAGTLIENNVFRGMNLPGIVLSSEANWKEGWHTTNCIIRGNKLINCGTSGTYQGSSIAATIIAQDASSIKLHHGILIENNQIQSLPSSPCGILIENSYDITLRGNQVSGAQQPLITRSADCREE